MGLAVQAVDGTKVAANAAGDQTCNARLERLLASHPPASALLKRVLNSVERKLRTPYLVGKLFPEQTYSYGDRASDIATSLRKSAYFIG